MALIESKTHKGLFSESDAVLAAKFSEAGFGFRREGGSTILHPLEAAYLAKIGKTSFGKATLAEFISLQQKKDKSFPFAFEAYYAIRSTGRVIRPFMKKTPYFRVYAPGVGREEERPSQLVALLPGKPPSPKSIGEQVKLAHLARLDLIIACGTEKEIQYYKISAYNF